MFVTAFACLYILPLWPIAMFGDGLFYSVVITHFVADVVKLLLQYCNLVFYICFVFRDQLDYIVNVVWNIFFIAEKVLHFSNGHTSVFKALDGMKSCQMTVAVNAVFALTLYIGQQADFFVVAQGGGGVARESGKLPDGIGWHDKIPFVSANISLDFKYT